MNETYLTALHRRVGSDRIKCFEEKLMKHTILFENFLTCARSIQKTFISDNYELVLDPNIESKLPTCLKKMYSPIITSADGSCLWHMVSICIFGNQKMSDVLRFVSTYIFFKEKNLFKKLIKKDILMNSENIELNENEYLEQLIERKYTNMVLEARNCDWGNEFHILSLVIAFETNIYIYGEFPEQIHEIEFDELIKREKSDNFHCGFHLAYKLPNAFKPTTKFICGFFNPKPPAHYSALVPLDKNSREFEPRNNIFK